MKVKDLIESLQYYPADMEVHTDEDDYPTVMGVTLGTDYTGPEEYKPPTNCVLLTIDFPKAD